MLSRNKKYPPAPERRPRITQKQQPLRTNTVFSYHASRSAREGNLYRDAARELALETPRHKKRASWSKRMPTIAGFLAGIILLGFFLQLNSNVRVQSVGSAKGQLFLRDKRVYQAAANDAFKPLLNRNKLTVNTAKINKDLKAKFPELQAVSVSLPISGNQPAVFIQPATPKLLLVSKDGMYVLDASGRALISGNQVARLTDLGVPVVNDESGLSIDPGAIILPRDTVSFIGEVVGQLQAKGITLSGLTLPAGTNELHVKPEKVNYIVKFNLHGNAREEAGAFLAVKQQLDAQRKVPGAYIDVRVENKAYYK